MIICVALPRPADAQLHQPTVMACRNAIPFDITVTATRVSVPPPAMAARARTACERLVITAPDSAAFWYAYAKALIFSPGAPDAKRAYDQLSHTAYTKAFALDAQFRDVSIELAKTLRRRYMPDSALAVLRTAAGAGHERDRPWYQEYAQALLKSGRRRAALDTAALVLKKWPDEYEAKRVLNELRYTWEPGTAENDLVWETLAQTVGPMNQEFATGYLMQLLDSGRDSLAKRVADSLVAVPLTASPTGSEELEPRALAWALAGTAALRVSEPAVAVARYERAKRFQSRIVNVERFHDDYLRALAVAGPKSPAPVVTHAPRRGRP